jgi:hypothetical protein
MSIFYVYEIVVDGIVRYVGKGKGVRCKQHIGVAGARLVRRALGEYVKPNHFYDRLEQAIAHTRRIEVRLAFEGLEEADAWQAERDTISFHGRIEFETSGTLWNRSGGGKGVTSDVNKGKKATAEHRRKISDAHKGKPKSAEHIAKQSVTMTGRSHSDEIRGKMSVSHKARATTAEGRAHLKKASAAAIRAGYSDERRERMRTVTTQRMNEPGARERASEMRTEWWRSKREPGNE